MPKEDVEGNRELETQDNNNDVNNNEVDESDALSVFEEGLKAMDTEEESQQDNLEEEVSEGEEPEEELESEDEDSEPEEDVEEEVEEDEKYEDIPETQVTAARMLGLSDEQIVDLAENKPDVLEKMAKNFKKDSLEKPDEPPAPEKPEVPEPELLKHMEMDLEDMDPSTAKAMSQMLQAHNSLIDKHNDLLQKSSEIDKLKGDISSRDAQEFNNRIDKVFDDLSENLPEVGNSRFLDDGSVKLRQEIYAHAAVLQNLKGMSVPESIEEAAFMWKMAQTDLDELEKKASSNLKKKLNKNKKRMSPRPGGRKTKPKEQSPREEAEDTLSKGMEDLLD